jgi:hypothetical protein
MTWDEPAASAGAASAVSYDLDLWSDFRADCVPDSRGQCGERASQSRVDNTEYLIIDNPAAGTYRLKIVNWRAPSFGLPAAIAAVIVRGDPTPAMTLSATPSSADPPVGSTFTVTTRVSSPSYVTSGVNLDIPEVSSGLQFLGVSTTREDGVTADFDPDYPFGAVLRLTLGDIVRGDSRTAVWTFQVLTAGDQTIDFRAWSENGGTQTRRVNLVPRTI